MTALNIWNGSMGKCLWDQLRWGKKEKLQGKALKRIFQLEASSLKLTYTGINRNRNGQQSKKSNMPQWCSNHKIKNSYDNRKVKQVAGEQNQNQFKNTFYQWVQKTVKDLQIDISDCTSTSTINQKKKVKGKTIEMIRKRTNKDMQEKTKCHTIQNDKWERKQYIKKHESDTIKISWKSDYIT